MCPKAAPDLEGADSIPTTVCWKRITARTSKWRSVAPFSEAALLTRAVQYATEVIVLSNLIILSVR